MSKFFQFPKVQKLSFTLVSTNANVDSALSPLPSKFLNICKEMAKYFATNVTQCKKNSVTTTIIVPLVVSITFYYTRAVLSIKHAFSVYVHNIVED